MRFLMTAIELTFLERVVTILSGDGFYDWVDGWSDVIEVRPGWYALGTTRRG
jgi:hypothetical protein